MHKLAERIELEELKRCGILCGDVEEMMKVTSQFTIQCHNYCIVYHRLTWVLFSSLMALGISWDVMSMMWAGTLK